MSGLDIGLVCFPSFGGSGVVGAELATGLAARGHRVHLIASAPPPRARPTERLHVHGGPVPDSRVFAHPPSGRARAGTIVAGARAARLDVLHVHYAVPHAASAYLAAQVLGAAAPRTVVTLHGTDVTRVGREPSYAAVTRFVVGAAAAVTVPSAFLRREAAALLGDAEAARIEVIPNFVDPEAFRPPARRQPERLAALCPDAGAGPVLFHASNFRDVKRPADLIEVLARLRRRVPARLVLVGDGPERAATAARARALGVAGAVGFLGSRADLAELLPHADAFLLTSESESFGVAALEALCAGVPVFAYRVGGLPEVVPPDGGTLVAPFDVDALAAAIHDALAEPGRRAALGRAARAHAVAHFHRDAILARYEACFRRVLEGRAGAVD